MRVADGDVAYGFEYFDGLVELWSGNEIGFCEGESRIYDSLHIISGLCVVGRRVGIGTVVSHGICYDLLSYYYNNSFSHISIIACLNIKINK